MRALPGPLATSSQSVATTLTTLVDITCLTGKVLYLTSGDRDVVYEGNTYKSDCGCNLSQVQTVLGTGAESVSITTLIQPDGITSAAIESGELDNATMRVLIADYTLDPVAAAIFFQGFVAQVTYEDRLTALVQGNPYLSLDIAIASDVFSSNCRADFGDSRCTYDIDTTKENYVVDTITSQQVFTILDPDPGVAASYWQGGVAHFFSGANKGFNIEIQDSQPGGVITLKGLLPYALGVGDAVSLYAGCNKTTAMCQGRWSNIANFQGEPFSVAPWVTTSGGDSSGPAPVASTGLYLYGTMVGAGLGPFNGPECVPPQARMPVWGPYADQWNFSGTGATSPGAGSAAGSSPANFMPAYYVSTKLTPGQYTGLGPPNGQGGNDVILAQIGFTSEVELTPAQAATVKLTYTDAPYDG